MLGEFYHEFFEREKSKIRVYEDGTVLIALLKT